MQEDTTHLFIMFFIELKKDIRVHKFVLYLKFFEKQNCIIKSSLF